MFPSRRTHPDMVDAVEALEFRVTLGDLKGAVCGDPENCAGAKALKTVPGVKSAYVRRNVTILEHDDGRIVRYLNTKPLTTAVDEFDAQSATNMGLFPAGYYRLIAPHPSRQLGAPRRDKASLDADPNRVKKTRKRSQTAIR